MKLMNKKGQVFNALGALGVGIAALSITLIVVFLILSNLASNNQVAADPNASAATVTLTNAAADIPDWVPLVVIATIGVILLVLVRGFRGQ